MNSKIQSLLETANSHSNDSSVSFDKRIFPANEAAEQAFLKLKKDLLNITEWNKHSAISSFELFDETGRVLEDKTIFEETLCRISMPGSGKYDWVRFIEIYEAANELVLTVTPTYDPTAAPPDKQATSHFMTSEATNNFCLLKDENSLSLYVIGLDEKHNTSETESTLEIIRNFVTANVGYYLGVQKTEWTTFCKNFLDSVSL